MYYGLCQRFDVADGASARLVQHQDDGLARSSQCLHQIFLIGTEIDIGNVAPGLGVGILSDAHYHIVFVGSSSHGIADIIGMIHCPAFRVVTHALYQCHMIASELVSQGFIDGIEMPGKFLAVGTVALPGIAPAAVECTHAVGIRSTYQQSGALFYGQ